MKISCILASYNRPKLVLQALKGLADQTYRDFELIVLDNSTVFDIHEAVAKFSFPKVRIVHEKYDAKERATKGILGINLNKGMALAEGDLFSFLCDDDIYFPTWFENAERFLREKPSVDVCYGRLYYTHSLEADLSMTGRCLFVSGPLVNPQCSVDHNQIVHRRFNPPYLWPEDIDSTHAVDAVYFMKMVPRHPFYAIDTPTVVKRQHSKNLQFTMHEIRSGQAEGLRE